MKVFFRFMIEIFARRTWTFVFLFLLLIIGASPFVLKLKVKPNWKDLLPSDSPSVVNLEKLGRLYGSEGFLVVGLRHPDKEKLIELATQFNQNIISNEMIDQTVFRIYTDFFRNNFLLYFDLEDLVNLDNKVKNKIKTEMEKINPLNIELEKEPKNDKLDLSDIKNKYLNKKVNEYLLSEDEKLIIVLIKPQGSPNSFNFLKKLIEFIYEELNKVDTKDGQFHYDLAGNYYDFYIDNKEITSDITRLSFLGGLLIIFTLLLYYRNLSALFVIAIPLFSGIYLNFALTQILIGHLNMMSGFLTTILMGLGLDFGIHLYTRFFKELPYKSLKRALVEGLTHTGVASIGGAITTGIAFYCLTIAQFKGFSEFGLVAGNGVLITALTTLSIQPLLIILLHRLKVKFPIAKKQNHNKNLFHHLVGKLKPIKSIKPFFICLFFFLIAISVFKAKDISFQYNFYKLRGEGVKTEPFEKEVAAILGVTSKPTILLFDDYESLKKMKKNLDQAIEEGKLPLLKSYQSIFDITPEDQEKKITVIKSLRSNYLEYKRAIKDLKKELGSLDIYQALNPMFIDYQTLPDNLKNQFVTTNGSHFFILAHPREVVFKDLRKAMDYFSQLNDIGNIKTDYQVAGINYVTTEIVRYIEKDSLPILIAVLLTLFLTVLFLFRNLKDVFVILTTLIVGVLFMLALMVSFEVKFNLLNIAIIPIILGMGIDSIIHICYRIKEKKDSAIVPQVLDIFPVLVLSNFTSILGFAVMIFASFNGIKTIGIVSCIGLFSILVISLVFLPFFLPFFYKENKD